MNNFKDMFSNLVSEVKANVEIQDSVQALHDEVELQKALGQMEEGYDPIEKAIQRAEEAEDSHTRFVDTMQGLDSRYMNRNDWRVARKFRKNSALATRKDNEDSKWDYLFASQGLVEHKSSQVVQRRYDVLPKAKVKASIRKGATVGKGSYMPTTKPKTTKFIDYTKKNPSLYTYKVVDYKIFDKAIVLEVSSRDNSRASARFDEIYTASQDYNYDKFRASYFDVDSRNSEDENTFHIVFTYQVLKNGKEATYSGVNQLREWLKTQKFIMEQKPQRIRDAVEMLKGEVITLPKSSMFTYSSEDDSHYVYTVFGDFSTYEEVLQAQ